jgi:phosphoribosylformylglycinamidine synthase
MKNDYGKGPDKISIPPTMLFTLLGDHPDVRKSTTSDFLGSGHHIYLLGETREELGANEIAFMLQENGLTKGVGGEVPRLHDIGKNLKMYTALSAAIHSDLVASAHDCSDGGLAVSLAEMCIGGRQGASIDISKISETTLFSRLYGESLARIVVAIRPENKEAFENSMSGNHFTLIGESTNSNYLEIKSASEKILKLNLDQIVEAWQSTFKGGDF